MNFIIFANTLLRITNNKKQNIMKRFAFIIFLCLVSIEGVFAQYQGNDTYYCCDDGYYHYGDSACYCYYYYDAYDVDKLLAIKAANPQSNLNYSGNNYSQWWGCGWEADDNHIKHLTRFTPMETLTTIDLSNCTNLQDLYYGYPDFGQLVSLNVSGCTNLQTLNCESWWFGQLISLNVSGCKNLQVLHCMSNHITSF